MATGQTLRRLRDLEKARGGHAYVLIVMDNPPTLEQVRAEAQARRAGRTVVCLDRADVRL